MEYYNTTVRRTHGTFSKKGLIYTLIKPHIYIAESLDDFLEEKDSIKHSTAWLKPGKSLGDVALVFFPECKFRYVNTDMVRNPGVNNYLFDMDVPSIVSSLLKMELESRKKQTVEKAIINPALFKEVIIKFEKTDLHFFQNAEIYDSTGNFSLIAREDVPEETLYQVNVLYHPPTKKGLLLHYDLQRKNRKGKFVKREQEGFGNLVPAFLPI